MGSLTGKFPDLPAHMPSKLFKMFLGCHCIKCQCFVSVRQVIPIIRGNESIGTPEYDRTNVVGRKKRDAPKLEVKYTV